MALVSAFSSGNEGTGLTISTSFLSQQVLQRVGTSKTVNIAGTCTGNPISIKARVVDFNTPTTAVTDWVTVATNPAGDVWSGAVVVPQGSWYAIEVQDGVNAALTAKTINKFGVGMVIGMIGQSNMANFRTTPPSPALYPSGATTSVEYSTTSIYRRVGNVADAFPPNTRFGGGGYSTFTGSASNADGYTYFVNNMSLGLGIPVCLVERAAPGSSIDSWIDGETSNNWDTFAAAVAAIGDCEMVIWLQGETDANTMSTSTMVTRLGQLHNQCKTLTGRNDSSFKFGIVSLGVGSYSGSSEGEFGNMRAAHVQYANNTAGSFLATSAHDTHTGDGVHTVGEGHSRWGRRAAKTAAFMFGVGVSGAGPRITSATRAGTQVTLGITHSGGTALVDGAGGNGSGLTGIEFKDSVGVISHTTLITGNSIVCILGSEPVGPLTVSYAMMNNPHNSSSGDANFAKNAVVMASIPYDNALYLNSVVGCPLQPLAATTVS